MRHALVASLALLTGCHGLPHALEPSPPPRAVTPTAPASWDEVLAEPSEATVRVEVAALWMAKRQGLINFKHPTAKAAKLPRGPMMISLHVGVIRHPERGDWLIDTGIDDTLARGESEAIRGVVDGLLDTLIPIEDTAALQRRLELDLAGVLLTHTHFDHVLGLPDIAPDVPVYVGEREPTSRALINLVLRRGHERLYAGRPALEGFRDVDGVPLAPFDRAIDVLGDRSIWALPMPGHTPGAMAYLVNGKNGPVLFLGDTCHTLWGWQHGVEPGWYTEDQAGNAEALTQLRTFVAQYPETRVVTGHELEP